MIKKNFSIWFRTTKKYVDSKFIVKFLLQCGVLFAILFFLTKNLVMSVILLCLLFIAKSFLQLFLLLQKTKSLDVYDIVLSKPSNPLFTLLVYRHNMADMFVIPLVLFYIKLSNFKK